MFIIIIIIIISIIISSSSSLHVLGPRVHDVRERGVDEDVVRRLPL